VKPKFTDEHKYPNGYTPSGATDIRKTFDRAKKRIAANAEERAVKVEQLTTKQRRTA
jgi:hypothetical protein